MRELNPTDSLVVLLFLGIRFLVEVKEVKDPPGGLAWVSAGQFGEHDLDGFANFGVRVAVATKKNLKGGG